MSEPTDPGAPAPAADGQLVVALAIVAAQTVLGAFMISVAWSLRDWTAASALGVGTIIGSLSTALNAPSGTAAALKALKGGQ